MPLNLLDGLPKLGGFNRLEKEEYYRLFIAGQEDTVELLTLASQVAADNEWTLEETVEKLESAKSNHLEAITNLGKNGLSKLIEFQEKQNKARQMQGFDLVKLMLQSRLSVDWLKANQSDLAEYGIEFDLEKLSVIPRREYLSSDYRKHITADIADLLPAPLLRPVETYALQELHEGKVPDISSDEGRDSDPLASTSESSTKPSKPGEENKNSGTSAISKSKPVASLTPVSTGKKSA